MPKYEPDTSHWDDDEQPDADGDETRSEPRVSVKSHRVTIRDERRESQFSYLLSHGGVRAGYPDDDSLDDFSLADAPHSHAHAIAVALSVDALQSTHPHDETVYPLDPSHEHDAVSIDTHEVHIDDLRENARDPRGMRYNLHYADGDVTGVTGGHYFEAGGERIMSQYDPMQLSVNDIPRVVHDAADQHFDQY